MSDPVEDNTSPLMDHIIELRNRLMYSVIAIFVRLRQLQHQS